MGVEVLGRGMGVGGLGWCWEIGCRCFGRQRDVWFEVELSKREKMCN